MDDGVMKALTVPLQEGTAALSDMPEPPESAGPVLVETLAVGVCGTDIDMVSGEYGCSSAW
jgi:D-arabinose 1-dehydrogenase-like Zn-dependent alcohol dehydrogenase